MTVPRPDSTEYGSFYEGYVRRVGDEDVLKVLAAQPAELAQLVGPATGGKERHRYAPGKWSVRQLVGHLTDAERVFGYRLFCISRGDQASLPGFDENDYIARSPFENVPLAELVEEFRLLREANLHTVRRLGAGEWAQMGTANDARITTRALAYIMAGHVRHHMAVLQERYAEAVNPRA